MPIRTRLLIAVVAVTCTIVTIARATPIAGLLAGTILSSGTMNDEIKLHVRVPSPPVVEGNSEENGDQEDEPRAELHLDRISSDPYTDPLAQHATEVEPLMVAHEDTIVTSIQVGRFQGVGSDNIGWATSKDEGRTWKHGFLDGITLVAGGTWPAVSLPTVAYDHKHRTYLIASMPFDDQGNGRGAVVSRSLDGVNWSEPIVAASSLGTFAHWIACDNSPASPFYGNCYDALFDYSTGVNLNVLVTSNDGGLTWGSPISAPDQPAGLVTSIAIQPNGNVVVLGRNGGPNGDQEYAIRSVDGGHTLEATADIATVFFISPFMRADPNLTSGVDADGTIYVVFPDCRFRSNCYDSIAASGCRFTTDNSSCTTNDLLLTTSEDGVIWTSPRRIPTDPVNSSVDHLIAGIGALSDPDDHERRDRDDHERKHRVKLAVTYYYLPNGLTCQPNTCQVSAGFISSDDGGLSWHEAEKVAGPMMESWLVPTSAGEMVANVNSAVFVDGKPHGAFAIARPPDPKTGKFDEAIYATELPEGRD